MLFILSLSKDAGAGRSILETLRSAQRSQITATIGYDSDLKLFRKREIGLNVPVFPLASSSTRLVRHYLFAFHFR
jgi:hypothetical protein